MTAWPANAYVGQRVVTIGDWDKRAHMPNLPKKGIIYTIREIIVRREKVGFRLVEIQNPPFNSVLDGSEEPAFHSVHFKPVDESKIDVFRKIAANPPKVLSLT